MDSKTSRTKVIGVSSGVFNPYSSDNCGHYSVFANVITELDWIKRVTRDCNTGNGDDSSPPTGPDDAIIPEPITKF